MASLSRVRRRVRVLVSGLAVAFGLAAPALHAAELMVSVAASLSGAVREVAEAHEAANPGQKVLLNTAASGTLLQQIVRGAPVDVFVSADTQTMEQARARGLVSAPGVRPLAGNSLVVIVPAAAGFAPRSLADLALPAVTRVAIGLPGSVPAGRYARAALEAAGLWAAVEPRMVGAVSVRQALDHVARGEVDAGFVYATDAALLPERVRVAFTVTTPQPVRHVVAVMAGSRQPDAAERFVARLLSPAGQAVFARHGFGRP
ncbi:MAG: molybdate ABC transporter substrate-binding protein [Betaproteobacteria bacterium]|nr:molybdate ABC transporter substrate-binding protein [Betaproteobacteria bacterium]